MNSQHKNLEKVGGFWDRQLDRTEERPFIAWMEHPFIKKHINRRTTGSESLDWFTYILEKYFSQPVERAVSLGCGDGGLERHALLSGRVGFFDAYDASKMQLTKARQLAEAAGLSGRVNYHLEDLNRLVLPQASYDATFASMSVHHIRALEDVFQQVRRALRHDGIFIMNEYVGPTQFQLPPYQLGLINQFLQILPPRYRYVIVNGRATQELKTRHCVHPLEWFKQNDPSEAVRSAEILSCLKRLFRIVEIRPYGGTLNQFVLENIVGNFDERVDEQRAWLEMLVYFERVLEEAGVIPSDFALIVASPQESS